MARAIDQLAEIRISKDAAVVADRRGAAAALGHVAVHEPGGGVEHRWRYPSGDRILRAGRGGPCYTRRGRGAPLSFVMDTFLPAKLKHPEKFLA